MKIEERFREISLLLNQHKYILDMEILKRYPEKLPDYFENWIDQIYDLSMEELVLLQNNYQIPDYLDKDLKNYIGKIKELSLLEKNKLDETLLPKKLIPKINRKKKHEIQILKNIIDGIDNIETVLDIGSGAGYLSSFLVDGVPKNSICVDKNHFFQEQGKKRLKKYSPENLEKINFINRSFGEDFYIDNISENTLVLGLHSCGDLSSKLIQFYQKSNLSALINIGCCYQDLGGKYNLSQVAKIAPITFTKNSLHLAARCHSFKNLTLLGNTFKVRSYRYSLHFYCQKEFSGVGNGNIADYSLSFAGYAKKFCPEILKNISDDSLNNYYSSKGNIRNVRRVILGDILRGMLGRLVELYIICDRALFLKEQNQKVCVSEIFDRKISPRNLCIYSTKQISK